MKISKTALKAGVISGCFLTMAAAFAPVSAQEQGPWLIRLRGIDVVPHETAALSGIGGEATINDKIVPELDFTYFFTENIAAELILATSKHKITAAGTALGDFDISTVRLLPPTLTMQYHFLPNSMVRPYVGAGVNYTIFYDVKPAGGTITSADYSNSFGPALQAGVDFMLDEHWLLNLDVKKIWIDTKATLNGGAVVVDRELNPWVFGVGVGYRF